MADREPRRRKKQRRDSQKKDDVRSDDHLFMSLKSDSKDSDQETEDEIIPPSHQPSGAAKFIFVILFSGLVISMSFIFISLRNADRGPVDIFEASHEEHEEVLHDHGEHEESEESFHDYIPGLSSILSFNHEVIESDTPVSDEPERESIPETEESLEMSMPEDVEETIDEVTESEETVQASYAEPVTEEPFYSSIWTGEPDETFSHIPDSQYTTESMDVQPAPPDDEQVDDEPVVPPDDLNEEDLYADTISMYERADITNEDDYEIKNQLDEIDSLLQKESEDGDDDDDDDDDDINEPEDEFDFWQL